jgi:ferric-dicitrate binding protein FerR (iron transport regulator)
MKHALEADLKRFLRLLPSLDGELTPEGEQALRERLARDPELAAAWRRLEGAWEGLELPPAAPVPPGFSGRVMAHARQLGEARAGGVGGSVSWAAAPNWVRASCAGALVAGLLLGAGLGVRGRTDLQPRAAEGVPALAESYWELVEAPNQPATAPALPSSARGEARR